MIMIQAKDLRFGNILFFDGEEDKITAIYSNGVDGVHRSRWIFQRLGGVPLSEDVLVRCGFEVKDDWALLPNFFLGFITSDENYQLELKIAGVDKFEVLNIKYLHQLQNLFYSIRGIELTYSPKE